VPTETDANRAFSICGTSDGVENDFPPRLFHGPTIFNGLWDETWSPANTNKHWGIYWQYRGWLDLDLKIFERLCFTADKFTKVHHAVEHGQGAVDSYENLLAALRNGEDIPEFCYIEPFWGWGLGDADGLDFIGLQGNDYHPPTWVGAAEHDLNELYEALKQSKQWDNMLFIISFDEHGGTWDHEPPPPALSPDGVAEGDSSFTFERLGVRVPTILVSPFIEPGTVFRAPSSSRYDFDHTSFIKTILQWAGTDPEFIASMGNRVANAPTFDAVLSDMRFPNTPTFSLPPRYAEESALKGPYRLPFDADKLTIQDFKAAAAAATSRETLLAELERLAQS
jgi:phospholipase C